MTTKQERLDKINELIETIGSCGRKFFYNEDKNRFSKMIMKKNKIYFIDDYTNEEVYAYNTVQNRHRGFSHGGTMWGLINDFREYIVTGEYTNGNNGYGGLYCPYWGYDKKDMKKVIQKAKEIGFLK